MGGTEHIRWISEPNLVSPTVIAAFTGWNDAADAASSALQNLVQGWGATALAEIDPELFTDFATIRPHVKLSDGRVRKIVWPTIGLWHARSAGSDVILLLGPRTQPALEALHRTGARRFREVQLEDVSHARRLARRCPTLASRSVDRNRNR